MGRQVDKTRNKSLTEVKDKLVEENAKPVSADEDKNVKQGSIFSFANCSLLLLAVIVSVLVPSVIVKTSELQQRKYEQDQTVAKLRSEAESLKQNLQKSLSESVEKAETAQAFIKTLQTDKLALNAKINDLHLQASSKDKVLGDYQQNEETLNEVNKKNEDQIKDLTLAMNSKTDSFDIEKKTILEKLKNIEQEKSNLQQIHDLALTSIKTEKESENEQLNQVLLQKVDELLISSQTIQSLQEQSTGISNEKLQISKETQLLSTKNTQLSDALADKSKTIESLQEQNGKLSNDLFLFRDESSKAIDILEEEIKIAINESEISKNLYLEDIMNKENIITKIEEDKQILEKTYDHKIATLENEHKTKLDILENSRGQMMEILEFEKESLNKMS
eukprot:GFUD01044506.1.p1 GENE.GFUD01044506.1~~GFUD01044506.1.p1  ORF type:complete len:391 (+),score=119.81 GFUD01044506.1:52-1224(+)